jgi:hypothetical protein
LACRGSSLGVLALDAGGNALRRARCSRARWASGAGGRAKQRQPAVALSRAAANAPHGWCIACMLSFPGCPNARAAGATAVLLSRAEAKPSQFKPRWLVRESSCARDPQAALAAAAR